MSEARILSISAILDYWAATTPRAVAYLSEGAGTLDYTGLQRETRRIAGALVRNGIRRGDRVGIVQPDASDLGLTFLGVTAVTTAAPLNPAYRVSEFEFYLDDLGVRALIAPARDHASRDAARALGIPVFEPAELRSCDDGEIQGADPADEALVLHTSGTTSKPKRVPLTHENLCHSAHNVAVALALGSSDRCLNVMPLFHIHGLVAALLASLSAGGSVAVPPRFDAARFPGWLGEFRPSWYTAVPTIHQAVLAALRSAPAAVAGFPLRFIRSSSAALPPVVMSELERRFGVPVLEAYGMTEAAHQMASNPPPPRVRKPNSVGVASGPEVAVMNAAAELMEAGSEGEVVIRGPNVTAGYENNAAANREAFTGGWFRTGDLGYLDGEGYLFLTGRLKEMINRGGEKIAPREIDDCLMEHPAVAQAVAFAVPHTSLGQDVAAAVVLRADGVATPSELRAFATERIAAFKVPGRVLILDEIPKGPTGKLQRIGLAERLGLFDKEGHALRTAVPYTAPRNAVEEELARLWARVLNIERVGVHDDFGQSGGDSLMAATLLSEVSAAFRIEPEALVSNGVSTVEEMARLISR